MPSQDTKKRWIRYDGRDIDFANLANDNADLIRDEIEAGEQALATARENRDRRAEMVALFDLGFTCFFRGQPKRATELYEQGLTISREIGDRHKEADFLTNMGMGYAVLGQLEPAIEHHRQALAISRQINDREKEANILTYLGMAYGLSGQAERAIERYGQALVIWREISNRDQEASTLNHIGLGYVELGQATRAIKYLEQALAISRKISDRDKEANILKSMGVAYSMSDQAEQALEFEKQALDIYRELGEIDKEATILSQIGATYHDLGQSKEAIEVTQAAVEILEKTGGLGADAARRQLNLYKQLPYVKAALIVLVLLALLASLRLCSSAPAKKSYFNSANLTLSAVQTRADLGTVEQKKYVSLGELYSNAPTNSTDPSDKERWQNTYQGMYVKEKGRFDFVIVAPQERQALLIATIFEEEGTATQIAFQTEDFNTILLGEREGSFLFNDEKWLNFGDVYIFEGMVADFSRFDLSLVSSGHKDLVVIKGKLQDVAPDDSRPPVTPSPKSEQSHLPLTPTAFYSVQISETFGSPIWDISQISCVEKPIYMWSPPGIYLYRITNKSGENHYITVERNALEKNPREDQCEMPWPSFGERLREPPEHSLSVGEYYHFCDYDRSRPPGSISITVEGSETKSIGLGTYQAVKVNTSQAYRFTTPPNYPQGNFTTSEWYVCGLGLIFSSTSHVGKYQHRDFAHQYGLELISYTPMSTNENLVRLILVDIQLDDLAEHYRVDIANEETAEALRRWDAGIRVENIDMFERRIIDGKWQITYAKTENPISGEAIVLTSDLSL